MSASGRSAETPGLVADEPGGNRARPADRRTDIWTDRRTYGRTTFVGVAPAVVFVRTPSRMDVVRFDAGDLGVVRVAHLLRRRLQNVRSTTHLSS